MDPTSFFDDLPTYKELASRAHFMLSMEVEEVVRDSSVDHLEIVVRRERIDSEDIQLMNPLFRPQKVDFLVDFVGGCSLTDSVSRKRKNSMQSADEANLLKDFRVH